MAPADINAAPCESVFDCTYYRGLEYKWSTVRQAVG